MNLQRRLAIVPGSDVLSPKEAQRILHECWFTDGSKSRQDHPEQGRGPRRMSSPKPHRRLCRQVSQRNGDIQSPGENTQHDERGNGAITMHGSKQDSPSKFNLCSGHNVRYGEGVKSRRNCQKSDLDAQVKKRRQYEAVYQDDHGRHSTDISEDVPLVGEITSKFSMQSSASDMSCASGATNVFSKPQKISATHTRRSSKERYFAPYMCSVSPCDTSVLDSAPFWSK